MRGSDVAEADCLHAIWNHFPEANLRLTAGNRWLFIRTDELGHSSNVLYVREYLNCFRFHPKVQLGEQGRTLKDVHVRVLELS